MILFPKLRKVDKVYQPKKKIVVTGMIPLLLLAGGIGGVAAGTEMAKQEGMIPLAMTEVDEIGRQQEQELIKSGIPLNGGTLTQFSDGLSDEVAKRLYEEMQKSASGKLEEYEFEQVASAKQAIACLAYEYLGGSTSPVKIYRSGEKFVIGWSDADEVMRQNLVAENYINSFYEAHEETISSFKTDKEKADYIAELVTTEIVKHYDDDYQVRTIYQLSQRDEDLKVGVCTVYTTVMDRLCELAGIQSYMEIGVLERDDSGTHCWNKLVFSDETIHYYDLTSYASVGNKNFLDMTMDYYDNCFQYRLLDKTEFGYKAGVNVVEDDDWF